MKRSIKLVGTSLFITGSIIAIGDYFGIKIELYVYLMLEGSLLVWLNSIFPSDKG